MKLYMIKRTGANWWGNLLFDDSILFTDGEKIFYEKAFSRKKDARKYLDSFEHKEFFEIATLELK